MKLFLQLYKAINADVRDAITFQLTGNTLVFSYKGFIYFMREFPDKIQVAVTPSELANSKSKTLLRKNMFEYDVKMGRKVVNAIVKVVNMT